LIAIELWKQTSQLGPVCAYRWFSTTLREILSVRVNDVEVFNYVCEHGSILITCNRDDYLSLAAKESNPRITILIRGRSRHVEWGHLLALLRRAGESVLLLSVNFA
jgi:hypothetical protein